MISLGQMVEEKIRNGESPLLHIRHVRQIQTNIQTNPNITPIPTWITCYFSFTPVLDWLPFIIPTLNR